MKGRSMTITPRRAAIAALTTITLMGTATIARADPTLTATATPRADGSVSLLAGWSCAAPFRQCSYIWEREDGSRVGTGRSYVAAAGVFAAGCHTVTLRLSYWFGRETAARKQTASAGFCVAGVAT